MLPMTPRKRNPRRATVSTAVSTAVSTWVVFSPLRYEPLFWLDAADASTITSSSGSVSQWQDKSGYARHASQSTSVNQPTTGSTTQNGLNVITFASASTKYLSTPSSLGYNVETVGTSAFFVIQPTSTVAQQVMSQKDGTGIGRYWMNKTTSPDALASFVDGDNGQSASTITTSYLNTWLLFDVQLSPGTSQTRLVSLNNDKSTASATAGTAAATGEFVIGASKLISTPFDGNIAEIIVYPYLTLQQVKRVRTYLNNKWAIY